MPSEDKLRRPAVTGTFHLYGFCHEVGHLAMYRVIQQRPWLSSAGAEGWAHYAGSRILDVVYAREGEKLWPDAYNYLEDGTARLRKQLAASNPTRHPKAPACGSRWERFSATKGWHPCSLPGRRCRWTKANPASSWARRSWPRATRRSLNPGGRKPSRCCWSPSAKSGFAAQGKDAGQIKGPRKELARDDGVSAGKLSLAGSGHAVRFDAPARRATSPPCGSYGSRYGQPQPPRENASIWLCDAGFKKIAEFPCPYYFFQRGDPKWVTIPVKPTQVPPEFIVCVGFNPTGTKGVYVHYEAAAAAAPTWPCPAAKAGPLTRAIG